MLACWAGNESVAELSELRNQADSEELDVSGTTVLLLWDASTGKQITLINASLANTIEGSPDGKWIAEGGVDKRIRIRDARTLVVVREILAHDAPVSQLKWHHLKPALVSSGSDQWIRIWNPQTGRLMEEFRRADLHPEELDISGDGKQLGVGNSAVNATEIFAPASFSN
jgi:WD40 repeat protein